MQKSGKEHHRFIKLRQVENSSALLILNLFIVVIVIITIHKHSVGTRRGRMVTG